MYAIVDIETTGGFASDNAIIEIGILIHDGKRVVKQFESLVNPGRRIPAYISGFTGITDEMTSQAPSFKDIAWEVYNLLQGKVFVAHNVNFDYSFVKSALETSGIPYQSHRLCTVRLSRKVYPGLKSYSLGNLCKSLNIDLNQAHRAMGDASATAVLFGKLLRDDHEGVIAKALRQNNGELNLPPHIDKQVIQTLPEQTGVYYFLDKSGQVIYVGKAANIRKRVLSHFSQNNRSERKQAFLREIFRVDYQLAGNELIALLQEAAEIKKHWPKHNRAMKSIDFRFGIFNYEDQRGIHQLVIERARKYSSPIVTFTTLWDARSFMEQFVRKNGLLRQFCSLEKTADQLQANTEVDFVERYNKKVQEAIRLLKEQKESFAILDEGREPNEKSLLLVEEGKLVGYGFVNSEFTWGNTEAIKDHITRQKDFNGAYNLITGYLRRPGKYQVFTLS